MNKKDRERLSRLGECIDAIPLPHDGGGTKTASMRGFVVYQADMRTARPLMLKVLNDMIFESIDTSENDIERGWDYDDPDASLVQLEAWIERRAGEGWE